ncbi:hypothetical protein AMTR_s00223p00018310 [Amborella trichopoda]|uniref:Uncharacterized protein n=1 Tax=Amborella trichopoda TaxID=13333 RepID=W1NQ86_AMBTC|nr:hypothetical protein AMTR_s00223p00018310 [Amborella trichopoda]
MRGGNTYMHGGDSSLTAAASVFFTQAAHATPTAAALGLFHTRRIHASRAAAGIYTHGGIISQPCLAAHSYSGKVWVLTVYPFHKFSICNLPECIHKYSNLLALKDVGNNSGYLVNKNLREVNECIQNCEVE